MTSGLLISEFILSLAVLVTISSLARYVHLVLFERYFKLTFEDAPVWSLFYFAFWTTIIIMVFFEEVRALFSPISLIGYLLLAVLLLIIFPAIFRHLRERVGNPKWLKDLYPGQGILSLEERFIFAKIGDVIFQQCLAGVLVLILLEQGLVYQEIVTIFLPLFTLAHIYIFRTSGFVWGMHYTAYAALGGFAFPFFIIFVPAGIAYSIVLHMLFYVLSAAFFAKLPRPNIAIERHLA